MKDNTLKIGFTGDIAFDEYSLPYYNNKSKIDKQLLKFLNSNDYNIIDLESPVTESNETEKEALFHKLEPKHLDYVKEIIKNPIADIANNHMMDFGVVGMKDTLKHLKKSGIDYIGAGKNIEEASKYIILGNKVKVGVIAIQYKDYYIADEKNPGPFHESKLKLLKSRIKEMREKASYVVVVYHGGEEFLKIPMPYTKKTLKKILSFGADIIVCHHPHVIQGYEFFKNKAIFYSLGNFIFDTDFQRAQKNTNKGILLSLTFNKEGFTFDYKQLLINRSDEKIELYEDKTDFKEIRKKTYKKAWKKEILKLKEISSNKKKLRDTRIEKFLSEEMINKYVPFSYFDGLLSEEYKNVKPVNDGILAKIKRNHYIVLLKNCFSNKKYRYYAYSKITRIFKK